MNSPRRTIWAALLFHLIDCKSTMNIPTFNMFFIDITIGEVAYIPEKASPDFNGKKKQANV